MARALVLIFALVFLRKVVNKARRGSSPTMSPYKNSLDGAMSPQQLSLVLADIHSFAPLAGSHPLSH